MLIIDANTWGAVFDQKNLNHENFSPVKTYILSRKGTVAWGGSKFVAELKMASKYLSIFVELDKSGVAIRFDDCEVDAEVQRITSLVQDEDFDDPHIIGLQIVSGALIIVTGDIRSHRFIKMKRLYPKNHARPKIYSSSRNRSLISRL